MTADAVNATFLLRDCPAGGCGVKMDPAQLSALLAKLPAAVRDPNLLAGYGGSEDAAVYRLDERNAVVSTVDFFPPMVDDPRVFGRIAAANALSDVYAMGGAALFALNLLCVPESADPAVSLEILAGGAEKVAEAGAAVAGGHTIYDSGIKYGLAVTGRVDPGRLLRNDSARPGDCLILTKPLGVGLILSAARAGMAEEADAAAAVASMERLNKYAAEKLAGFPVSAATDVTGFGLLAHALEMAGENLTLVLDFDSLPILPGALRYAEECLFTAAGQRNRNHVGTRGDVSALTAARAEVVFDPQTSGGLLIAVAMDKAEALCAAIREDDPAAAIVGVAEPRGVVAVACA